MVNKPFIVIAAGTFLGAGLGGGYIYHHNPKPAPVPYIATPAYLEIPKLNLKTEVESVTVDENGNMGIPVNIMAVGWYSLGPRPGEVGNAVIDGHLNTPELTPGVFWGLDTLNEGDILLVVDHYGQQITFKVTSVKSEPYSDFPVEKYFGPSQVPRLHLITCQGTYERDLQTFNLRTVVSADRFAISSIQ